ncbi:hypothetical protein ScPMuIL_006693 [Solemya velum]
MSAGHAEIEEKCRRFNNYMFEKDSEFLMGWKSLSHNISPSHLESRLLEAKLFYYSRQFENVRLDDYRQWLKKHDKLGSNSAASIPSVSPLLDSIRGLAGTSEELESSKGSISTPRTLHADTIIDVTSVLKGKNSQPGSPIGINQSEIGSDQVVSLKGVDPWQFENSQINNLSEIRDGQSGSSAISDQLVGPTNDHNSSDIKNDQPCSPTVTDQSVGLIDDHNISETNDYQSGVTTVIGPSVNPTNEPCQSCTTHRSHSDTENPPLSLEQLAVMVEKGITIPGIENLNIEPLNENPSISKMGRHKKPWEK